jgi:hypothetical protein
MKRQLPTVRCLMGQEKMTKSQMMALISEILGAEIKIRVHSNQVSGHYFQTPYSYSPKLGQKLIRKNIKIVAWDY